MDPRIRRFLARQLRKRADEHRQRAAKAVEEANKAAAHWDNLADQFPETPMRVVSGEKKRLSWSMVSSPR
jgi:ABC-type phosphate transport system ATPase subunit